MGWLSPDSRFYNGLTLVTDTVIINVMFLLCSLPIVTIGAAATGAHAALIKQVRDEGSSPARLFWKGFKSNFGKATILWLAIVAFAALFAWEIWAIGIMELEGLGFAITTLVLTGIILIAGFAVWCFAYLSQFRATLPETIKASAFLAFRYLPRTLVCLALLLVQPLILFFNADALAMLVLANILIVPAFIFYVHDILLNEPLGVHGEERSLTKI
ncbi:MAG: DUF624 domain-containing protein [Flaviflexus sp.]|uniref:DUF624 domain-containing protein n=1 Tax=Flaviflexus sp. TaxID=1969482 RepID=UPI00352C3274